MIVAAKLCLALAAQIIYFYRNQIAAQYPVFKPYLQQACAMLGCRIELLKNQDALSIETSGLESTAHSSVVVLHATLRNRAALSQAFPLMELTLTDVQNHTVARRILKPDEYLRSEKVDMSAGMLANGEIAVKVYMDIGDLKASGYRLLLFYS